jgi:hypothetical protein
MFAHASTTHQFGVYLGMLIFALAMDDRGKSSPSRRGAPAAFSRPAPSS